MKQSRSTLLTMLFVTISLSLPIASTAQENATTHNLVSFLSGEGPECECACGPYGYVKVSGNSVWAIYYRANNRKIVRFDRTNTAISYKSKGVPTITIQDGQITKMEATDDLRSCLETKRR